MVNKAIIIGSSTAGKTTILRHLRETIHIPLEESDDILISLNGGTYPHDTDYKMNILAPKMVEDILQRKKIIFFTNVYYFTPQNLEVARRNGFKIIQLALNREQMESRNKHRMEHEGYDDLSIYFDSMETYQKEIVEKGLVDRIIDTDKPVKDVTEELIDYLQK